MKYLYQCSKCGAQFEDYDKCATHENSHKDLNISATSYDMQQFNKYSGKAEVPEEIMMGYFDYSNENAQVPVLFKYKLVGIDKEASKLYLKQKQEEEERYRLDEIERNLKMEKMIALLAEDGIEVPNEKKSYYQVREIFKKKYDYALD